MEMTLNALRALSARVCFDTEGETVFCTITSQPLNFMEVGCGSSFKEALSEATTKVLRIFINEAKEKEEAAKLHLHDNEVLKGPWLDGPKD